MFDLGWPEILVIAIVLIVVVGPKDLPRMLRTFGRTTSKLREMAGDFRKQFDDALKEAELDDVKDLTDQARKLDPRAELRKHLSPLEKAGKDIKSGLDDALKPKPSTANEPASDAVHTAEPAKAGATNAPVAEAGNADSRPAATTATKAKTKASPKSSAKAASKNKAGTGKSASSATSKTRAAPKKTAANGAAKPASATAKSSTGPAKAAAGKPAAKSASKKKPASGGKPSGTAS